MNDEAIDALNSLSTHLTARASSLLSQFELSAVILRDSLLFMQQFDAWKARDSRKIPNVLLDSAYEYGRHLAEHITLLERQDGVALEQILINTVEHEIERQGLAGADFIQGNQLVNAWTNGFWKGMREAEKQIRGQENADELLQIMRDRGEILLRMVQKWDESAEATVAAFK
ncbi:hypothetical protein GC177_03195 [bacterium]|nr:hypothetical protein [bacterium]